MSEQSRDLPLRLCRHFIGDPSGVWSIHEVQAIYSASESATYRAIGKLIDIGILAKIGGGLTLNPSIVGELYGKKTELRKLKTRIENQN